MKELGLKLNQRKKLRKLIDSMQTLVILLLRVTVHVLMFSLFLFLVHVVSHEALSFKVNLAITHVLFNILQRSAEIALSFFAGAWQAELPAKIIVDSKRGSLGY